MSFMQCSVLLFFIISIVSCVSFTPTVINHGNAIKEFQKVNTVHSLIPAALVYRVKTNNTDRFQLNVRVKKTTDQASEAAKLPPMKIIGLMVLMFRNMFSKKPIDGEPPLSPDAAVEPFVKMTRQGLAVLREKVGYKERS